MLGRRMLGSSMLGSDSVFSTTQLGFPIRIFWKIVTNVAKNQFFSTVVRNIFSSTVSKKNTIESAAAESKFSSDLTISTTETQQ